MLEQHALHFQLDRNVGQLKLILDNHNQYETLWPYSIEVPTTGYLMINSDTYGRSLFDHAIGPGSLREALLSIPPRARLTLHIDEPDVATIPWEYLRAPDYLLAAHLTIVRYIPPIASHPIPDPTQPLSILAIPVDPIDDPVNIHAEGEWETLKSIVQQQQKSLSLVRVRPPTLSALSENLSDSHLSLIHFMGHCDILPTGKTAFIFEDRLATSQPISPQSFIAGLSENVFLVLLNSCFSAVSAAPDFNNIAYSIVRYGVPYAIGMPFKIPDDAAHHLTSTFYKHILQDHGIEESMRYVRQFFERDTTSTSLHWAAGLPVLYTNLLKLHPPFKVFSGTPTIVPDPSHLQSSHNLVALARTDNFIGRVSEQRATLELLLAPNTHGFVLLHGLGGIGKTALAGAVARRASWYYNDRVFAHSFETFATFDNHDILTVSSTFANAFYTRLATFYNLDARSYLTTLDLQKAIIHHREHQRSLLVLDSLETLVDAQRNDNLSAQSLASFISALATGQGTVLLTSRSIPPSNWGQTHIISLAGLHDDDGASLFLTALSAQRQTIAPFELCLVLSKHVQGHPLAIRLLADRFDESASSLATFSQHIEDELFYAKQIPASLEDPERQKSLYACLAGSINHLTAEQRTILQTCSSFHTPFLPENIADLFIDESNKRTIEEQRERIFTILQQLNRLGLLIISEKTCSEGTLQFFDLHTIIRWYIHTHIDSR